MAQDDIYPTSRLTAIAYAFLGVGFLLSAYRAWKIAEVEAKGPRRLSGPTVPGKIVRVLEDDGADAPDGRVGNLANETLEDADKRTRGAITKVRTLTVFTIDQRVAEIRRLMLRDSEDPKIIEAARGVLTRQCGGEWCLPVGTLVLRKPYDFVPIEQLQVGDEIMGDGRWVGVRNVWDQGRKPLLAFTLNNGGVLRCTPEHRLMVVPKVNQLGNQTPSAALPGGRELAREVPAADVREGMDLLQPERLPFGVGALNADMALIVGAYVAEGWLEPSRVSIAGVPDAKGRREAVIAAAEHLGIRYSVDRFKVRLMDKALVAQLESCGRSAMEKRFASIDVDEATARSLIWGVNADAHIPTRAGGVERPARFDSTSYMLALQYRVMQRMFGRSASLTMGKPGDETRSTVFRVGVREGELIRGGRAWARIRSVAEDRAEHVFDVEVEGGLVYLPEHDVLVHNCIVPKDYDAEAVALFDAVVDPSSPIAIRYTRDHPIVDVFTAPVKMLRLRGEDCDSLVSFLGALLLAAGAIPEMVTVQTKGADTWSHIFLRVPRDGSDGVSEVAASEADHYNYLYLDPSMPDKPAGWAPPGTQYVLATGRPAGIVVKARVWNVL